MSKHRLPVTFIPFDDGTYVYDVQNNATCTCAVRGYATCPRHNADRYADQQARHATDSISAGHPNYVGWAR